jgi:hypothetical protein
MWLLLWWFLLAFQMTYGKHITEAIAMTESERVYYTVFSRPACWHPELSLSSLSHAPHAAALQLHLMV